MKEEQNMNTEQTTSSFKPVQPRNTRMTKTFSFFSKVSPQLTTKVAAQLFISPQRYRLSRDESALLAEGTPLTVHVGAKTIHGHRWGVGPSVLLVHGWSGAAAQFTPLIRSLTKNKFSVIAFDLPAHGQSGGKRTNLFECMNTVQSIASTYGPFHGVVGHSFGGLVSALAASKTELTSNLILISPLRGANYALSSFGSMIGVSSEVQDRMRDYFEQLIGIDFADCDFEVLAQRLNLPTLVVHDRGDRILSWQETNDWVEGWDSAELVTTEGLGHQRILADNRVATRIREFLGEGQINIREAFLSEYAL